MEKKIYIYIYIHNCGGHVQMVYGVQDGASVGHIARHTSGDLRL